MNPEHGASRARYLFPPEEQPKFQLLQPLPTIDGGFACIEADCPWAFKQWSEPTTDEQKKKSRAASRHYQTMSLEELEAMPVKDVAARDAHLWFWTTGAFFATGTHIPIMRAWGFEPTTTGLVWVKLRKSLEAEQHQLMTLVDLIRMLHIGTGKTTRKNVEFCVLGRRGSPQRLARDVQEVVISPRREHSRKPEEAYERIQRYCPGPRLQLFARQPRAGWTVWGNETEKFA